MTLDQWMAANGRTDTDLAQEVGVSRPFITRIRKGTRQPSLPVAVKLAQITQLPVEVFTKERAA